LARRTTRPGPDSAAARRTHSRSCFRAACRHARSSLVAARGLAAAARPDKPKGWNTQITELLISPFTQQDYDQVRACISAIAPIEARGMKVVTRVELVAALLASACDHAYTSGEEDAQGDGPNLFALTEELVLRRAREIYAQGHG